jgi:hypothetical protein
MTRDGDLTLDEYVKKAEEILRIHPNAEIFAKWTCPRCGDRCTADIPNAGERRSVRLYLYGWPVRNAPDSSTLI